MRRDNTKTGLVGEFYVLAQLNARGLIGTLTLGHTKGVDILVRNPENDKLFQVEVKTSTGKKFSWILHQSAENRTSETLIYIFVHLVDLKTLPSFFIVPAKDVSHYIYTSHRNWLAGGNRKDTTMRKFIIEPHDPKNYQDKWDVFK